MVGGWKKKDDGALAISSTNIFAALESRRKKANRKVPDIAKQNSKGSSSPSCIVPQTQARVPAPISWADWEEDDDEYFAMSALQPLPSLDNDPVQAAAEEEEDDVDDDEVESSCGEGTEGYDELEEGNEENKEPHAYTANKAGTGVNARMVPREPGRQLSKKDLKKKELAELEAALVELGLNQEIEKDSAKTAATKEPAANDGLKSKAAHGVTLAESKSSKKRKGKKDKSVNEGRQTEYVDGAGEVQLGNEVNEAHSTGPLDKGEVLKKLSSVKKKKPREGDAAAKAAAAEAAIRAAKVAAARKKEKNHYNEKPVR